MDGSAWGRRRGPGQILVIFAVFLAVGVVILQLSLFLYSALRQKAAAEEIARAAARAGCAQQASTGSIPIGFYPFLDESKAAEAVRDVLLRGLPHLPYRLSGGKTVEDIVDRAGIYAENAWPNCPPFQCAPSPVSGKQYDRPYVAVCFTVPTEAFFLPVDIRVCAEDAVEVRD